MDVGGCGCPIQTQYGRYVGRDSLCIVEKGSSFHLGGTKDSAANGFAFGRDWAIGENGIWVGGGVLFGKKCPVR